MAKEQSRFHRLRRTWFAVLTGCIGLILLLAMSVVLEPYLIAAANIPPMLEPRSANGWANSQIWVAAVGAGCIALVALGYIAKRLSPPGSTTAVISLLMILAIYVFFAQFPATRSLLRIVLWCASLPFSFTLGVWLASLRRSAV